MKPSEILFSKPTIKPILSGGDNIHSLIEQIGSGYRLCDRDWFPLEVAKDETDGKWYTLNNRRLYIFRVLEKLGRLNEVEVIYLFIKPVNGSFSLIETLNCMAVE